MKQDSQRGGIIQNNKIGKIWLWAVHSQEENFFLEDK
jgi:hypothetical protein